jgi:hypothetical protein
MAQASSAQPAATNELLLVHVRQAPAAVVPMPTDTLDRLTQLAQAHATHPPPQVGRRIALRAAL